MNRINGFILDRVSGVIFRDTSYMARRLVYAMYRIKTLEIRRTSIL